LRRRARRPPRRGGGLPLVPPRGPPPLDGGAPRAAVPVRTPAEAALLPLPPEAPVLLAVLLVSLAGAGGPVAGRALEAGIGDLGGEELDRPDGVVVAGDDEVDPVGVAVGVHHPDHRNAQA